VADKIAIYIDDLDFFGRRKRLNATPCTTDFLEQENLAEEKKSENKDMNRRKVLKVAGGVVVVALAGGAYYAYQSQQPTGPAPSATVTSQQPSVTQPATSATTGATSVALSEDQLIQYGFSAFEKAQNPLAEPKDWTSPPPAYSNKKEIVIGASMPLTGIFSWAAAWQKLKDQWVQDVNSRGGLLGLPVRSIVYDDASDATRAITNYTKLLTVDKVDLLWSGAPTATMVPVMSAIDQYGYNVLLSGSSDYESFLVANNGQGWNNAFEIQVEAEFFGYGIWPWIGSLPASQKPKNVGIIYGNYSPFTVHGAAGCKYFAQQQGLNVVYEQDYPTDVTDYTPLVNAAKQAGVDVLMSADTALDPAKLILEAMRTLNYQPSVFWTIEVLYPGFEDSNSPGHLQPLTYYTTGSAFQWDTWPDPPFKDAKYWTGVYKNLFGINYPNFDSAWGPFECQIIEQAVQSAGSLDQGVLKQYMLTHSFNTLFGNVDFHPNKILRGLTGGTSQVDGKGALQVIYPQNLLTAPGTFPRPPWSTYAP
jgi:branched-chain amino acid transport system substrate-binding protein